MILRILIVILAIVAPLQACTAKPDAEGHFTNEMMERIERANPTLTYRSEEPLTIIGRDDEGNEFTLYLNRIFGFCAANPVEDCDAIKQSYIEGMTELGNQERSVELTSLRIVIRPADYLNGLPDSGTDGGDIRESLIFRQFAPGLIAILAVDYPRTIGMATREDLTALGVEEDQAWDQARSQVLASVPSVPDQSDFEEGLIVIEGFDYGPSLMLATDGWNQLAEQTNGDFAITVPDDGLLVILLTNERTTLESMSQLAEQTYNSAARQISPYLFQWRNGEWIVVSEAQ